VEEVLAVPVDRKQNRGFILGSLSLGHGFSHLYDQGFPVLLPAITSALGLSNIQVATLLGIRQAGFGVVNLGGGVFVDMVQNQWGLILTGCMIWAAVSYMAVGASPNYPLLAVSMIFISIPGALWHLPATAALSRRFPDRRGFAISIHGFGSNIGNVLGPLMAGALLLVLIYKWVLFIYAAPALVLALFVWWSLKDVGREGGAVERRELRIRLRDALVTARNPVVLGLVLAATLRGLALNAMFHWAPFYLKDELGMGPLGVGVHYALLTGMGIASAPLLGLLSDRFGRKAVLAPGLLCAMALTLVIVSTGDNALLPVVLAGVGLFSFALHQIIQAAVLDAVGRGTEATAIGLIFGLNGVIGGASPFLETVIIDHLGGYGSIFYYAGIMTAAAAAIVMIVPFAPRPDESGPETARV
jgi:MFS family permease